MRAPGPAKRLSRWLVAAAPLAGACATAAWPSAGTGLVGSAACRTLWVSSAGMRLGEGCERWGDMCTLRATSLHRLLAAVDAYARVDALAALERGDLPTEPSAEPREGPCARDVAREWALAVGLRAGNTMAPPCSALERVVARWAEEHGYSAPGAKAIGHGLVLAGIRRRRLSGGHNFLLLNGEDSRRLRRMCREAWAPEDPPGMKVKRTGRPRGRPKGSGHKVPHNTYVRPDFHQHRAEHRCTAALADSIGRVWPCAAVAAAALGGAPRVVANRASDLRNFLQPKADVGPLRTAIQANAHWRGVWWRRLTPEEVAAVPQGTKAGDKLRGPGWGLVCQKCGADTTDGVWSGPHI